MQCMECFPPTIYSIYIYTCFSFPSWGRSSPIHYGCSFCSSIFDMNSGVDSSSWLGPPCFFCPTKPAFSPQPKCLYGLPFVSHVMFLTIDVSTPVAKLGRGCMWKDIRLGSLCWHGSPGKQLILRHPEMWHFIGCLHLMVLRVLDLYCKEVNVGLSSFFQAYSVFFCVWDTLYLQCWRWIESRNQRDEYDLVKLTWPCLTFLEKHSWDCVGMPIALGPNLQQVSFPSLSAIGCMLGKEKIRDPRG